MASRLKSFKRYRNLVKLARVIVQTDLLNNIHPSTIVCPLTSNVQKEVTLLRVHLKKNQITQLSDILVDQIRAIDNQRFIKKIGRLNDEQIQ